MFYNSLNESEYDLNIAHYLIYLITNHYFHQLLTQYFSPFYSITLLRTVYKIIRKNFFFSNNTLKKKLQKLLKFIKNFLISFSSKYKTKNYFSLSLTLYECSIFSKLNKYLLLKYK
jgi:hypothetical protein